MLFLRIGVAFQVRDDQVPVFCVGCCLAPWDPGRMKGCIASRGRLNVGLSFNPGPQTPSPLLQPLSHPPWQSALPIPFGRTNSRMGSQQGSQPSPHHSVGAGGRNSCASSLKKHENTVRSWLGAGPIPMGRGTAFAEGMTGPSNWGPGWRWVSRS